MKLFNRFDLLIILLVFSGGVNQLDRELLYPNNSCGPWSDVVRPIKSHFLECIHRKTGIKYSYRIFN